MKTGKHTLILLLITLGLFPVFFGSRAIFRGFTQTNDRKEKQITRPSALIEPFDVVEAKSGERKIEFGKAFRADGDWLKDFSISYKNRTNKRIVSFSLSLFFPETTESGNMMAYSVAYGTPLSAALRGERTTVIQPEEIVPLSIDDKELNKIKTFLEQRHLLKSLSRVELHVGFILFDDGTAWDGQYRIPDPKNPRRFIVAPQGEEVIR